MKIEFGPLLNALWTDFHQPEAVWQIATLAICLGLGWIANRAFDQRYLARPGEARLHQRGLRRLVLPLTALVLVLVARPILENWYPVTLLSLAVPLLLSLAVIRIVFFALRIGVGDAGWLANFEKVFASLAWTVVVLHITGLLPGLIQFMEGVQFAIGKQTLNLWLIQQGIGLVLVALLLALWIGGAIEARLMAAAGLDSNLRVLFSRLAKALLIILAVLIGLPLVGIDLTTLSVFGGALGVGLGFGLQKIAANYASGFIILLDRSIGIGNLIAVGKDRGVVTRITTRYTVLLARSGIESIIPNEMLVSSVVANEAYSDKNVRLALPVQVAYKSDVDQVMQVLVDAALSCSRVLHDPRPRALITLFADSGINFELRLWIADPEAGIGGVRSEVYVAVWRAFKDAEIEIPFPQREVRLLT